MWEDPSTIGLSSGTDLRSPRASGKTRIKKRARLKHAICLRISYGSWNTGHRVALLSISEGYSAKFTGRAAFRDLLNFLEPLQNATTSRPGDRLNPPAAANDKVCGTRLASERTWQSLEVSL